MVIQVCTSADGRSNCRGRAVKLAMRCGYHTPGKPIYDNHLEILNLGLAEPAIFSGVCGATKIVVSAPQMVSGPSATVACVHRPHASPGLAGQAQKFGSSNRVMPVGRHAYKRRVRPGSEPASAPSPTSPSLCVLPDRPPDPRQSSRCRNTGPPGARSTSPTRSPSAAWHSSP